MPRTATKSTRTLVPATLWAGTCLLIAVAAAIAIPSVFLAPLGWLPVTAFVLLTVAALALLTMSVVTLPHRHAYEWDADLDALPPVWRWPVRVGTWIGVAAVFVTGLVLVFGAGPGSDLPSSGARFAMSIVAVLGAIVSLATAAAVPPWAFIGLLCVWCAVVVIVLMRGICGLVARLVR